MEQLKIRVFGRPIPATISKGDWQVQSYKSEWYVTLGSGDRKICKVLSTDEYGDSFFEALLIAEAGNIANKYGKSPKDLYYENTSLKEQQVKSIKAIDRAISLLDDLRNGEEVLFEDLLKCKIRLEDVKN